MDFQRLFLIIGIVAVTYLLILEWNGDYGQVTPPVAQQSQQPTTSTADPTTESNSLPTPAIPSEENVSNVPPVEQVPTTSSEVTSSDSQLVFIETDVLKLQVDLKGGDIVGVSLPKYPISLEHPEIPFTLIERNQSRTYVSQSGLIGKDGPDNPKNNAKRPIYQSTAQHYSLGADEDTLVVNLTLDAGNNISVTKQLIFKRGDYAVQQDVIINNQSSNDWQGQFFAEIKRDSSGDPSLSGAASFSTYLGPVFQTNDDKYVKVDFDDIDDEVFRETVNGGWVAMVQHYFLSAWVPNPNQQHVYQTRKSGNHYYAGFVSSPVTIKPESTETISVQFYAGPKSQDRLKELAPGLELTVDYGVLWFIAKPLFWLLNFCYDLVGNWGVAIIMLTLLVKLAFFKLSANSYKSMANMRRLQPKLTQLRERHSGDRQKQASEMMALYRKEKINPMGGCLPIVVQMPVFLALYWVLLESVELRQAPFFLWVQDLAIKDPFFILPLLMGGTMFLQMMLNPSPQDPMQARVMKMMPIIFTFLFLWFPAGLVLYWLVNNILSISQQWIITRSIEKQAKKA